MASEVHLSREEEMRNTKESASGSSADLIGEEELFGLIYGSISCG
jgi:hypothetical protein